MPPPQLRRRRRQLVRVVMRRPREPQPHASRASDAVSSDAYSGSISNCCRIPIVAEEMLELIEVYMGQSLDGAIGC
jgi:hypothetical protein